MIANPGVDTAKPVRVEMVSKTGSDSIHGLIYYKRGSSAFNAKSFFDTAKSTYKLSEVQGELGGAMIPRWTYFYAGAMYQKTPFNQTLYADLPTSLMRNLDFSQYLNASTAPNGNAVIIRDPRNGAPFPNNVIPINRRSAVANNYLSNFYPASNTGRDNTFTSNYTWQHPFGSGLRMLGNWPFGRIDQRISSNTPDVFPLDAESDGFDAPGTWASS